MTGSRFLPTVTGALLLALVAGCDGGPASVGVILGDPTGLSFSQTVGSRETVAFALDLEHLDDDLYWFHLDYDFHEGMRYSEMDLYWGVGFEVAWWEGRGGHFGVDGDTYVALRVPLGLRILFDRLSHLFLQIAIKAYEAADSFEVDADLALGVRFGL